MKNLVCLLTCLCAFSTLHAADQEYVTKVTTAAPQKEGVLQPPVGQWAKSQFQTIQTRAQKLADLSENDLKNEAEKGGTDAQIRLGLYYFATKREADAVDWLRKAAERNTTAASYLGVLSFAKADYKEAKEWIQKIADKGNAGAKEFLNEIEKAETDQNGTEQTTTQKVEAASTEDAKLSQLEKEKQRLETEKDAIDRKNQLPDESKIKSKATFDRMMKVYNENKKKSSEIESEMRDVSREIDRLKATIRAREVAKENEDQKQKLVLLLKNAKKSPSSKEVV